MGKELIIAICLGAFLGFGLMGSFFGLKNFLTDKTNPLITAPTPEPTNPLTPTQSAKITVTATPDSPTPEATGNKLVITEPKQNSLSSVTEITVKGTTLPGSLVVITNKDTVSQAIASDTGTFSAKMKLESGLNEVNIASLDKNDNSFQETLFITYSNVKI